MTAYKSINLNYRILVPIIAALVLLLIIGIYTSHKQFEGSLEKYVSQRIEMMRKEYIKEIEHKTDILESTLQLLRDNPSLIGRFIARDRHALKELTDPIYQMLAKRLHISHLYFSDLQRVNFLRAHNSDRYGDTINRLTTLSAEKTNTMVTGIDLGIFGALTLRSVTPWHDEKGNKIGYIELGININQILKEISDLNEFGLFLAIQKSKLSQDQWEEGQRLFGGPSNWDQYKNFVVSNKYGLSKKLFDNAPNLGLILQAKPGQNPTQSSSGKTYQWQHIPLDSFEQTNIGQIFIAIDTTDWISTYQYNEIKFISLYAVISILLILTLYRFTNRAQTAEIKSQNSMRQLRKVSNNLETAQHMAHIGSWELKISTNELNWSNEVFRIFDIDKDKFAATYEAFLEAIHPEDRENVNKAYTDSLKDKKPYEIEHRLLMKDGSVKYIHERCETAFDKDGNPVNSVGTIQDISEQKQNESLANQMKHMLEHSVEEIYIFDGKSLQFLQVSSGALLNLGYDMKEMSLLTPLDLKPDYTAEEFRRLINPLIIGTKELQVFETRHRRKNGSHYPVEVRLQFTREDVSPVFLAIILDLSERKHTEAKLKSYRHHLEELVEERTSTIKTQASIIDQTHDSVVTTDLEGFITSWNGGAERLFKIESSMALGQHISLIYPEREHQNIQTELIEPLKQQGIDEKEVILRRGDDSEFTAHLSLSLLLNDDDTPKGMVCYSLDISGQKQREKELSLLTQQLQDSNKELEAFSYSVSHDLRSPLRSIDGFSLALIEDYGDQLDDTAQDYLKRVRNAAQRMGRLIDDLLQLSRVNRAEITATAVDLNSIAQSIFNELQNQEPERKVEFMLDEQMQVQGDPRLLRMALNNLIGNAWKFTAKEENAQITLKSLAENPDIYCIKDNGAGFDMRHADKLFGVFQRLHQTAEFPGTGIGLATVQRIIHRHGGRIWAESEPEKGATFFFTLMPSIITPNK